jgi:hypothetical protein
MALLVYLRIIRSGMLAVGARWNDRDGTALLEAINQCLAVIPLVGNHMRRLPSSHERWGLHDIVRLPACEMKAHRAAFGIRRQVDFGRQASTGTPQRLVFMPPFPAAAC